MAVYKTKVVRQSNDDQPRTPILRPAQPRFPLPPKLDRVHSENEQLPIISKTAVDGNGVGNDPNEKAQAVRVVEFPIRRDPVLRLVISLDLSQNPATVGPLKFAVQGNTVLYADSTNGTDRFQVRYAKTDGDQLSQPYRSMVPGRLRREARFNFIYVTWTQIAAATATIEVYDDPDAVLEIFN